MTSRYEVAQLLHDHEVTSCLWSEDVLWFYGVPTVGFELYLLIPDDDLEKAACIISASPGYRHVPPDEAEMANNTPRRYFLQYWSYRFVGPPCAGDDITGIQLLPAKQFAQFEISPDTTVQHGTLLYPKLADFIEALVNQYLRPAQTLPELAYRAHVCMHIGYLADYVSDLEKVLQHLSPKAGRLWGDILKGEMMLGESGIELYSNIGLETTPASMVKLSSQGGRV